MSKERLPTPTQVEPAPLPNGPAAAAILAGGVGAAFYGMLIILTEASPTVKSLLTLNKGVGPLSGKTTVGTVGFLVAWIILARVWQGKDVDLNKMWPIALGLIVLSLIFTFPPFFLLFASH